MGFKDLYPNFPKKKSFWDASSDNGTAPKQTYYTAVCSQYCGKTPYAFLSSSFLFLYTNSETSNNYQFHLYPHFPKPFFSEPTPIKSLCSTLLAWIPEATHLTLQVLHFLPRSVNTLQSISNYSSLQNTYLSL